MNFYYPEKIVDEASKFYSNLPFGERVDLSDSTSNGDLSTQDIPLVKYYPDNFLIGGTDYIPLSLNVYNYKMYKEGSSHLFPYNGESFGGYRIFGSLIFIEDTETSNADNTNLFTIINKNSFKLLISNFDSSSKVATYTIENPPSLLTEKDIDDNYIYSALNIDSLYCSIPNPGYLFPREDVEVNTACPNKIYALEDIMEIEVPLLSMDLDSLTLDLDFSSFTDAELYANLSTLASVGSFFFRFTGLGRHSKSGNILSSSDSVETLSSLGISDYMYIDNVLNSNNSSSFYRCRSPVFKIETNSSSRFYGLSISTIIEKDELEISPNLSLVRVSSL